MGRIGRVFGIVAALLLIGCEPLALKSTIVELSDPPTWSLSQAPLMGGAAGDEFGYSVDMSENYVIIGAYLADEGGTNRGAAFIYQRLKNGQWQFQQKIVSDSVADGDLFGAVVAISDDYAVVTSAGVGSIEVFERIGSSWTQVVEFSEGGTFGAALDIDGIYLIAGDYNGSRARIYYKNLGIWSFRQQLTGVAGTRYGYAVSLYSSFAVVGAYLFDDVLSNIGKAYVYQRSGINWALLTELDSSTPTVNGNFGRAVSISSDQMAVIEKGTSKVFFYGLDGTEWRLEDEESVSGVVSGDNFGGSVSVAGRVSIVGADNTDSGTGSAYVFEKYGDDWVYKYPPLTYSKNETGDAYGNSVATNGSSIVVGANFDDNSNGADAGSGYLFIRE